MGMSIGQAQILFDILVQECGESEHHWAQFLHYMQESNPHKEYRFGGTLGFGGKFYLTSNNWYVDCYSEDRTPLIDKTIEAANKRLTELRFVLAN